MDKTTRKQNRKTENDIRENPTPDAIKEELGKLFYLRWIFAIFPLITILLTVTGLFSYSIAGIVALSSILLLILSFKNKNTAIKLEKITGSKNDTNGHSAVIVLVSIFILSLLCMLISGLTSGIIEILEIINSNK